MNGKLPDCHRHGKVGSWPVRALLCGALFAFSVFAQVQLPEGPPPTPEVQQRLKKLESELRCLVCQNQTLADSPAGLATDLRREVRTLIEQGKTDAEVKSFLQARYGDFVLYRPPMAERTVLLWFGPFLPLLAGGGALWWQVRRRRTAESAPASSPDELARARALLESDRDR